MDVSRAAILDAMKKGNNALTKNLLGQFFWLNPNIANAQFVLKNSKTITNQNITSKIAFCRSFTVEPVIPLLCAAAITYNLDLSVYLGGFNTYVQDILDPKSGMYEFDPQVVVLAVQTRDIVPRLWYDFCSLSLQEVNEQVEVILNDYRNLIKVFRSYSQASLIIHNLDIPLFPNNGILDAQSQNGQTSAITRINQGLLEIIQEFKGIFILDYGALVARYGKIAWGDEKKWLTARMPIAAENLIYLVKEYIRYLLPLTGRIAKALVVDLDNTLWGGVIGEDGINGILIGAEYPGVAYRALQQVVLDLYKRGVILAICSKNNQADALDVFENHKGMLLHKDHFSAMRINWMDKTSNLRNIASELNIGLDALAFLDDNPVERERIRLEIPEIFIINLPDDPMKFSQTLRDIPIFERLTLSEEDRLRGSYYIDDRKRKELQKNMTSMDDFYRSLKTIVRISHVNPSTLERTVQLINKTNQFNLTTRRYTEQRVQQMIEDPSWRVYTAIVQDKFGDNGLVGVVITNKKEEICEIDTFLLSCRVIGRKIESAILAYIVEQSREQGAETLRGLYLRTAKNDPVKDFYSTHNFQIISQDNNKVIWDFDLIHQKLEPPSYIVLKTDEK